MKVGIITILKVENYGAELQAYATQAVLKNMGYDAEIIDYLFYKNKDHHSTKASKPIFKFGLKKKLSERLFPILKHLKESSSEGRKRRAERFSSFHKKFSTLSPTYNTIEKLYNEVKVYDAYITGSDQVWNPGVYSSLKPYFLDFAPEGKKRIAYAASFGVSHLPTNTELIYHSYLSKYNSIGVRESAGVEIVKKLGLEAIQVLDPTLLLSSKEWLRIAHPIYNLPQNYLLIYELTPSPYLNQVAKSIASKLNLQIVRLCKSAKIEDNNVMNITDAGPSEFITLFKFASFVITNSFHGSAFSINFEKPFFVIIPKRKNNNSRQKSLLNLLGISGRILEDNSPIPQDYMMDYQKISQRLDEERNKSLTFLKNAIDG